MPKGKCRDLSSHKSRGLEARIRARNISNALHGLPEGWADEALDLYISGCSYSEIAEAYGVKLSTAASAIPKAALFRIMTQQHIEMEDIK